MLPQVVEDALQRHLAKVQLLHEEDHTASYGAVYLPYALARKYSNAETTCANSGDTILISLFTPYQRR